ncbi:HP1A family protein [Megaselia abdita]
MLIQQSVNQHRPLNKTKKMSESETLFEVEAILNRRHNKGTVEYLVKWQNFDSKDNSWVQAKDMVCPGLIEQFEIDHVMHETLNPFQRGFEAECLKDAMLENGLKFFVKFYGKQKLEWVSNTVVRAECPQLLIEYYENRVEWEK